MKEGLRELHSRVRQSVDHIRQVVILAYIELIGSSIIAVFVTQGLCVKRLLVLLALCTAASVHADISGRVVAVTDGDTIKVLDAENVEHKVRLTGIDAPERKQPFGNASRKSLAAMVAGKEVRVESSKNDRYGRALGKVWVQPSDCSSCGKTLDANHAQALAGMAWWYRYYAKEQSPEDRGRYESAEDEAKARKRGLWADPNPINPYKWRKGQR